MASAKLSVVAALAVAAIAAAAFFVGRQTVGDSGTQMPVDDASPGAATHVPTQLEWARLTMQADIAVSTSPLMIDFSTEPPDTLVGVITYSGPPPEGELDAARSWINTYFHHSLPADKGWSWLKLKIKVQPHNTMGRRWSGEKL